jgi:hypothetical protein
MYNFHSAVNCHHYHKQMSHTSVRFIVVALLSFALLINCSSTTKVQECIHQCINERGFTQSHCELYCEYGYASKHTLTILEDGIDVTESQTMKSMSDNIQLNFPVVRFDKVLFNTKSAFDEMVQWTSVLKQQVAAASENVFKSDPAQQFHLLPMPIVLSGEQLSSKDFMNRLIDVVPDSDLVYRESSPLTFSEAYKQFLLDVKIDQQYLGNTPQSAGMEEKIRHMEQLIQNDMDQYLVLGDRCYVAYDGYLQANGLKRIAYTFDAFAPTSPDCIAADKSLESHSIHSKELSQYLDTINPYDQLFKSIADQIHHKQDWNFNKHDIDSFIQDRIHREATKAKMTKKFQVIVNMIRYYFKKEYFGNDVTLLESCVHAHLNFSALGWTDIPVHPHHWYNQQTLDQFMHHPRNSNRNYFGKGGLLQRMVTQLVIAYRPTLKIVISKAMKETFVANSARRNFRPLELGPYLYTKVEFKKTSMMDTYEMVLTSKTNDPQVIGFKTKSFQPIPVTKFSTNEFAYCKKQQACKIAKTTLLPVHRYYGNGHHFYTTNSGEAIHGYVHQGIEGKCIVTLFYTIY